MIAHLPQQARFSVLIMHGAAGQSDAGGAGGELADALRERGAKVETCYFPTASHDLGKRVEPELRAFLRDNLLGTTSAAASLRHRAPTDNPESRPNLNRLRLV